MIGRIIDMIPRIHIAKNKIKGESQPGNCNSIIKALIFELILILQYF
jgi:hypothetical protein